MPITEVRETLAYYINRTFSPHGVVKTSNCAVAGLHGMSGKLNIMPFIVWMAKLQPQVTKWICNKILELAASGGQHLFPRHTCVSRQNGRTSIPGHRPTVLLCITLGFRDTPAKRGLMWKLLISELARLIVLENRGIHSPWSPKASWLQGVPAISLGPELPQLICTWSHV